jgi:predicted lipid-binding transport protein (Tim44 family)
VAVELGLRLAVDKGLLLEGHSYLVRSDNSGVVQVVNKGRSRNRETNKVIKEIYQLQGRHGIRIVTEYVASRDNVSDALSRGDIQAFLHGFPTAQEKVAIQLPDHLQCRLQSL